MKNNEYWRHRAEILEELKNRSAEKYSDYVRRQFALAQKTIEEQIEQWYGRFAKNNQISLLGARQWLTDKDLAEFKWDVSEYIKYGKDAMIDPAFIKQLENASARFHVSKLDALKLKTQSTIENLYGKMTQGTRSLFGEIYADNYYHSAFELEHGLGIGWDIASLNPEQIESVLSKPWTLDKSTFSDRIWKQKTDLLNEVQTQLTQNMILGKAPDAAISAIAKRFGTSKANAGRLVMTESAYFANEAQRKAYQTLGIDEFEIVATLDGATCEVCGGFDAKHFPMSQYEVGVTTPPFHPWCRCTTAPYFDDMEGERFARDEKTGELYYVPSDMAYNEWKDKFIDDGDKSGLTPVDNNGAISWIRDHLKNITKGTIIKTGSIEKLFGKKHTSAMRKIVSDAPDDVKAIWNKYADELKVGTVTSKQRAFYNRVSGVNLDLEKVADVERYMGEVAKKPYYTAFHEFGHNIDDIVQRKRGEYRSIADIFQSKKYLFQNGTGYTLTDMLKFEGTERINSIWQRLKQEAVVAGGRASDVRKFRAYQEINTELLRKSVLSTSDVSDIWSGITGETIRPHYGHSKAYWNSHSVGIEAFAEMFGARMMNPDSLAQIKYYFPKAYAIFEEILKEIGGD